MTVKLRLGVETQQGVCCSIDSEIIAAASLSDTASKGSPNKQY